GDATLARIVAGSPVPPRRRFRRVVGAAVAAAGAAIGVALLAVLVIAAPDGGGTSAPEGYGVEVDVHVAVPGGSSMTSGEATAQAARIIMARARARHLDDIQVTTLAPGSLRVTVPGAVATLPSMELLASPQVALYDLRRSEVARGNPVDLVAKARTLAPPDTPLDGGFSLLIESDGFRGQGWGTARSRAEALSPFSAVVPGGRVEATPRGYLVVPNVPSGSRGWLLRGAPAVFGDAITGARLTDASTVELTLSEEARRQLAPLAADAEPSTRVALLIVRGFAVREVDGADLRRAAETGLIGIGDSPLPQAAARQLAGGGSDAIMEQGPVRPFGTPPPRAGVPVEDPVEVFSREALAGGNSDLGRPITGTALRVLSKDTPAGTWRVYSTRTSGHGMVTLVAPGHGTMNVSGECALNIDNPRVVICMGSGGGNTSSFHLGRVHPSVATVDIVTPDGKTAPAHVENGWFLAVSDDSAGRPTFVARDAEGRVVAEETSAFGGVEVSEVSPAGG
ncbi:MAG: hypothetical protein AB1416_14460, partial [Actinomycetota bacterium]